MGTQVWALILNFNFIFSIGQRFRAGRYKISHLRQYLLEAATVEQHSKINRFQIFTMTIKCICNGSRGTDCDYCGGSGWITEKISLGPIPVDKLEIEPEKIWKRVTPTTGPTLTSKPKKTIEQRLQELEADLKAIETNVIEDTIVYMGNLLTNLYFDIKKFKPELKKNKEAIEIYQNALSRSINLIRYFDKRFPDFKLTD